MSGTLKSLALGCLFICFGSFAYAETFNLAEIEDPSFSGSLADFNTLAIDFCSPENDDGARSAFVKKVSDESSIPLCFQVKNNSDKPALLSYKLVGISSGNCNTQELDIGYDTNFESEMSGSKDAIVAVNPISTTRVRLDLKTDQEKNIVGCMAFSPYYPEHLEENISWGLFKIQLVRTRAFDLSISGAYTDDMTETVDHAFSGRNFLKDQKYHMTRYNNNYLITYYIHNSGYVFSSAQIDMNFGSLIGKKQISKTYDLPPQTKKAVFFLVPYHRYDLGFHSISLKTDLIQHMDSGDKQTTMEHFEKKVWVLTPLVYFFAFLVVIVYNVFAWFVKKR